MNYYKHHIGDYAKKTAHLSLTEHGVYTLMLQSFYGTEKPLPSGKALYRLLRAETKIERKAVDSIVEQFWTLGVEGLTNRRALLEIAADKDFISQQRERANKRWHMNGTVPAYAETMPAHESGINPAMPPTPTPTPIEDPTPTPPKGGAGHRRSPARAEKDAAAEVWNLLIDSGGTRPKRDPRLQAAIDAVGGWSRIQHREQGIDAQMVRKAFCEAYRNASAA